MFAEKIKVGTKFVKKDKHLSYWYAVVTKRTQYFVDVEVINPYDNSKESYRCQIQQKAEYVNNKVNFIDDYFINIPFKCYKVMYNLVY